MSRSSAAGLPGSPPPPPCADAGAGSVVIIEREHETGGIPRHARHQGFGIRDLHRIMSGPDYAARLTEQASHAGAELRTATQATGWTSDGALETTSASGRRRLRARAVVLATGCRERPRAARFVAGSRPQGVMTTGMLQQLVYLLGEAPGRRAVVVGAEHVSFSSLLTLEHGGAEAAAIVTSPAAPPDLRRLPRRRRAALQDAAAHAHRGDRDPWSSPCRGRDRDKTSTPALNAGSRATSSSSPATGSPTTSSPSSAASTSTREPAAPASTPASTPRAPASSPPATSCTAPRPPTSRHSAAATSPKASSPTSTGSRGRARRSRSSAPSRCTGSRPTPSHHPRTAPRHAAVSSCAPAAN